MSTHFGEFHAELRTVAREVLGKTQAATRGERSGEGGADWSLFAHSGWLGVEVPEAMEGAGATFAEVAIIVEEMGRAVTSSPYLGSVVLGVGALDLVAADPTRDDLLRAIASGDALVAVGVATDDAAAVGFADAAPFRLEAAPRGYRVRGEAAFVPDAAEADHLLLLARDPASVPVVVHLEPGRRHLTVTPQPVLDATRRVGVIEADGVEVNEGSVWRFALEPGASAQRLLDRGAVAAACDSLGVSEAMMDATVAYAGERVQFGRPIGSFQAVKHACADMLVQISVARALVSAAVKALAGGDPSASTAVSMAKSHVCSAAVDIAGKAMQLHGGIGYTWESGVHAYVKRAAFDRALFGSPAAHRRRLAARYTAAHPNRSPAASEARRQDERDEV